MAVPKGEKLNQLLTVYGLTSPRSFETRIRNHEEKVTPRDELLEIAGRLSPDRFDVLIKVAKRLADGTAILMV